MVLKQKLIASILILAFFVQGVYSADVSVSSGGSEGTISSNTKYVAGNDADISNTVALDPANGNTMIQSTITGTDDANLKWSVDNGNSHADAGFSIMSNGGSYSFKHNQGFLSGGLVYADLRLDAKGVSNVDAWSYANTKYTDATTSKLQEMIAKASILVEDSPDNPNSVNIAGYYTKAIAGPDYVSAHQEITGSPIIRNGNTNINPASRIVPKIEGSKIAISTYAEQQPTSIEPPEPAESYKTIQSYSTATGEGSKFTAYNADVYSSKAQGSYISVNSLKAESPLGEISQIIGIDAYSIYWGDFAACSGETEVSNGYIDGYQARAIEGPDYFETKQNLIKVNGGWRVYTEIADSLDGIQIDEKSGSGPTILKSQAILPPSDYLPKVTITGSYTP
jgi:hypothetical protein